MSPWAILAAMGCAGLPSVSQQYLAVWSALFTAAQGAVPLRNTLAAIGFPQGPTTAVTDNTVAKGIADGTIKQKRSRAINIAYHWVRDQVTEGAFTVRWDKGSDNLADYQTKAVPISDFRAIKATYQDTHQAPRDTLSPHQLKRCQRHLITPP
jgi:hypothetical protein